MRTIRLDRNIVGIINKAKALRRLNTNWPMSRFVAESLGYFLNKHEQCFACPFHRDVVVGLELRRQRQALDVLSSGVMPAARGQWVLCPSQLLDAAKKLGAACGKTTKQVVEQAILEHIAKPSQCDTCPFYAEMKEKVRAGDQARMAEARLDKANGGSKCNY